MSKYECVNDDFKIMGCVRKLYVYSDAYIYENFPRNKKHLKILYFNECKSLFDNVSLANNTSGNKEIVDSALKIIQTPEIKSEENIEKELKTTTSLLDRMILEAKKDIKTSSKEEVTNLTQEVNKEILINPETIENTEEVKDLTKNVLENNKNHEVKSLEVEKVLNTIPTIKQEPEVNSEEIIGKDIKTKISLLDRMIIDANKDIKVLSKEELKNFTNIVNPEVITNTEDIKTLDVNPEVKVNPLVNEENQNIEILNSKPEVNIEENITKDLKDSVPLKEVKVTVKEELKSLNNKVNEDLFVTTLVVDNKEVQKTTVSKIVENEEKIEVPQNIEELVILTNKIIKAEVPEASVKINVDEKLNVLNNIPPQNKDTKISLMDQLILKNSNNPQSIIPLEKMNVGQGEVVTKELISNIYLSSQKNSINTQELFNRNEAINLLKDAKSIDDVKTSAGMLDLGLEDVEVDLDEKLDLSSKTDLNKKTDLDLLTRKNQINNLMLEKNIKNEDVKVLITKSVEASNALLGNSLQLADDAVVSVNSPLSYNIQSKIIGARQQMSAMMSDIAKQMYENYKPPVTVFRINLNPLELGSIAILMKSDRNNALTISMSASNNGTLEALVENQNILRSSLNKTFDENTKFNFDFSSSNQDKSQSKEQNNQQNQSRFEERLNTQAELELKEENRNKEEISIDYM